MSRARFICLLLLSHWSGATARDHVDAAVAAAAEAVSSAVLPPAASKVVGKLVGPGAVAIMHRYLDKDKLRPNFTQLTEDIERVTHIFGVGEFSDGTDAPWGSAAVPGAAAMAVAANLFMKKALKPMVFPTGSSVPEVAITGATALSAAMTYGYLSGTTSARSSFGLLAGGTLALYSFAAIGDPKICPMRNGEAIEDACVDYSGPAVVLCFGGDGRLQTLDFVGVCHEDGTHCMEDDAWWVGEQWRLNTTSGAWLYRDARAQHLADVGCGSWPSQRAPAERPPAIFIQAFHSKRSFLLHELQPRIVDGPPASFIWEAVTRQYAPEECGVEGKRRHAQDWLNAGLVVLGEAQSAYSMRSTECAACPKLAEFLVKYGVSLNLKASM